MIDHTRLPNEPAAALDLTRYLGLWHEVAHLPMFFQRHCADQITATYTQGADGSISVLNACRTRAGTREASTGTARACPGRPGAFKVTFVPPWLRWLPGAWADYWVIDLDPAYQWAVVGSPSRRYLWVLSRRPIMQQSLFQELLERAQARGYPVQRLVLAAKLAG